MRIHKVINILILFSLIISLPTTVFAGENNIYGIHLAQPHYEDLVSAAELVNGNSGDWGYMTLVIQENDRDKDKWQDIFNRLRKLHIIPLIRLATKPDGAVWMRPHSEDGKIWADFLDSLLWPVKDRYVILFNEPNHGSEWGGSVDAVDYGKVAFSFAKTLKEKNSDFQIILAGFDAAAPSSAPNYEDEYYYLEQLIAHEKRLFDYIDAWSSHSYPNPGFSASPYKRGRNSITTYDWELSVLRELGIEKELPVFITETGWIRKTIKNYELRIKNENDEEESIIAQNLIYAFGEVWGRDERVRAVTPFVLDYQGDPFLGFSWKMFGSNEFYGRFDAIKNVGKEKGAPFQYEKLSIDTILPKAITSHSSYVFIISLKNEGQAVWDQKWGYAIDLKTENVSVPFMYFSNDLSDIDPGEKTTIQLHVKTGKTSGHFPISIDLYKDGYKILDGVRWNLEIVPQPSISFTVSSFPKINTIGRDFEIQVFNSDEQLVYKHQNIIVDGGSGIVDEVSNITLGERYRVVIMRPYYLPRQVFVVFKKGNNSISFRPLLPFDFNADGKFTLFDIIGLIKNPRLLKMLIP